MKTFYMHHYLCIVQCVDEKKKIRCTLLNINAKQRNAKIKKKIQITILVQCMFHLGGFIQFFRSVMYIKLDYLNRCTCQFSKTFLI